MRDAIRRDRQAARASPPSAAATWRWQCPALCPRESPPRSSSCARAPRPRSRSCLAYARGAADASDAGAADAYRRRRVPGYSGHSDPVWLVRSRLALVGACCRSRSSKRRSPRSTWPSTRCSRRWRRRRCRRRRALLGDSQREMNTITRMLSNMSKRYVVVRAPPTTTAPTVAPATPAARRRRRRRRRRTRDRGRV